METQMRVEGLKELQAALRKADKAIPKQLQKAHKSISVEVADKAQSRMRGLPGVPSRVAAKAAKGIRARAGQRSASIALLGSNPVVRGVEFGAHILPVFGRRRSQATFRRRVFPPWSGNQWSAGNGPPAGVGYAVYPVIREMLPRITDEYADRLYEAFDGFNQ
jgi:hypothetical protein